MYTVPSICNFSQVLLTPPSFLPAFYFTFHFHLSPPSPCFLLSPLLSPLLSLLSSSLILTLLKALTTMCVHFSVIPEPAKQESGITDGSMRAIRSTTSSLNVREGGRGEEEGEGKGREKWRGREKEVGGEEEKRVK